MVAAAGPGRGGRALAMAAGGGAKGEEGGAAGKVGFHQRWWWCHAWDGPRAVPPDYRLHAHL